MGPIKKPQKRLSGPFLFLVGSTIFEHIEKHNDHHDRALLTLPDWTHHLAAEAASVLGEKIIGILLEKGRVGVLATSGVKRSQGRSSFQSI